MKITCDCGEVFDNVKICVTCKAAALGKRHKCKVMMKSFVELKRICKYRYQSNVWNCSHPRRSVEQRRCLKKECPIWQ